MKKILVLFLAVGLTGCEHEDPKICTDTEALVQADYSPVVRDPKSGLAVAGGGPSPEVANTQNTATLCIKEWGWKLSKSQGPNEELADAVMVSCQSKIEAVIRLPHFVIDLGDGDGGAESEAKHFKEVMTYFKQKAMVRVIQGRAGHCRYKS